MGPRLEIGAEVEGDGALDVEPMLDDVPRSETGPRLETEATDLAEALLKARAGT